MLPYQSVATLFCKGNEVCMSTFEVLLLAHLLGDFPFQTNRIFRMKLAGTRGLTLHVAIHLLVAMIIIFNFGRFWLLLLLLGVTHFVTDWIKVRLQRPDDPQLAGFVVDQIVHVLIIWGLALWQPTLPSIFPDAMLIPAILVALIPAVMMLGWVWANDLCQAKKKLDSKTVVWACSRLLPISQWVGWAVVCLVIGMGVVARG